MDLLDGEGRLRLGGASRRSSALIIIDHSPDSQDGIGVDVAETSFGGNARAANKLGDWLIGQDTAKNGTKDFGIVDVNGNVLVSLNPTTGVESHGKAITLKRLALAYSASMTPDASLANLLVITATNNTAFTINAPTNPTTDEQLKVQVRNTSGGALGAATWNAIFKMTAWTNPANGFSRTIEFVYDGTNWVEIDRTAADVPN
jgi:hypothetical protein